MGGSVRIGGCASADGTRQTPPQEEGRGQGGRGEENDHDGGRIGGKRGPSNGKAEPKGRNDLCLSDLSG